MFSKITLKRTLSICSNTLVLNFKGYYLILKVFYILY